MVDTKLLNAGIDSWVLFGLGELPDGFVTVLEHAQQEATQAKRALATQWSFAGQPLLMEEAGTGRGTGRRWDWALHNAALRLWFRPGVQDGIIARAEPTVEYLYQEGAQTVTGQVQALLAHLLGSVRAFEVGEVRLCADMLGWSIEDISAQPPHYPVFMIRRHGRAPRLVGEAKANRVLGEWEQAQIAELITSWPRRLEYRFDWVAPGAVRVYDKRADVVSHPKAQRQYIYRVWKAIGWKEEERTQVLRVEFTYDHQCLQDMGLEHPYDLLAHLSLVWAYATHDVFCHIEMRPGNSAAIPSPSLLWQEVQAAIH